MSPLSSHCNLKSVWLTLNGILLTSVIAASPILEGLSHPKWDQARAHEIREASRRGHQGFRLQCFKETPGFGSMCGQHGVGSLAS